MKKLLTLTLALLITACASTDVKHEHKLDLEDIERNVEKTKLIGVSYCGKNDLYKMVDSPNYYNFVCTNGASFMFKKRSKD